MIDRSRTGLVLRSVGESPASAHALGYRVRLIRLAAVVAGGALCGLAGAYISLIYTPLWVEGMVAGKGWIALALTTFGTWRPLRVLLGAYLFGRVLCLPRIGEQGFQPGGGRLLRRGGHGVGSGVMARPGCRAGSGVRDGRRRRCGDRGRLHSRRRRGSALV